MTYWEATAAEFQFTDTLVRQADTLVRRYLLPRWGKLSAASIARADVKAVMATIEAPR